LRDLFELSEFYLSNYHYWYYPLNLKSQKVLHIQRTKWPLGKLKDHVTFPIDNLDMKPYCTVEAIENVGSDGIYELVGVVNHHGQAMDKGKTLF